MKNLLLIAKLIVSLALVFDISLYILRTDDRLFI